MFSSTTEYALRAVIYLAGRPEGARVSGAELARALEAPENYMSKTLHGLARAGVLDSTRGKGGGFRLAAAPGDISLLSVASVFDRIDERRQCLLGRPQCRDDMPCPMHDRWKPLAEEFAAFLRETTVADLAGTPAAIPD